MRDVLGPSLSIALSEGGPIDLIEVQRLAMLEGDECHHRTEAATAIVAEQLKPYVPDDVYAFMARNGQWFLNMAMVSAKLATVLRGGRRGLAARHRRGAQRRRGGRPALRDRVAVVRRPAGDA